MVERKGRDQPPRALLNSSDPPFCLTQVFFGSGGIALELGHVLTVNPARAYTWTTRSICLAKLLAVLTGTCSAVINLIRLDTVIRKAVPSTKKTSAAIVTILLCSTNERGIAT